MTYGLFYLIYSSTNGKASPFFKPSLTPCGLIRLIQSDFLEN